VRPPGAVQPAYPSLHNNLAQQLRLIHAVLHLQRNLSGYIRLKLKIVGFSRHNMQNCVARHAQPGWQRRSVLASARHVTGCSFVPISKSP
jgi:hypothetical protein